MSTPTTVSPSGNIQWTRYVRDYYDWDPLNGGNTDILSIPTYLLYDMHKFGIARNYDIVDSMSCQIQY